MKHKLFTLAVAIAVTLSMALPVGAVSLRGVFDAEYYAAQNPDVAAVWGKNANKLYNHYIKYGFAEGRSISPVFDLVAYKALNPDLAAAFGDDASAYVKHYYSYGIKENRKAGATLNPVEYAAANPDVAKAFGKNYEAIAEHYLKYGFNERRNGVKPVVIAVVAADKKNEPLSEALKQQIIRGEVAVVRSAAGYGTLTSDPVAVAEASKAALAAGDTTPAAAIAAVKKAAETAAKTNPDAAMRAVSLIADAIKTSAPAASTAADDAVKVLQAEITPKAADNKPAQSASNSSSGSSSSSGSGSPSGTPGTSVVPVAPSVPSEPSVPGGPAGPTEPDEPDEPDDTDVPVMQISPFAERLTLATGQKTIQVSGSDQSTGSAVTVNVAHSLNLNEEMLSQEALQAVDGDVDGYEWVTVDCKLASPSRTSLNYTNMVAADYTGKVFVAFQGSSGSNGTVFTLGKDGQYPECKFVCVLFGTELNGDLQIRCKIRLPIGYTDFIFGVADSAVLNDMDAFNSYQGGVGITDKVTDSNSAFYRVSDLQ